MPVVLATTPLPTGAMKKMAKMTRREKILIVFGGIVLLAIFGVRLFPQRQAHAERRQRVKPQKFRPDFRINDFRPSQAVKAFPAIENPPHVNAETANEMLQPNELVLGVTVDGVARAYPINMLTGPSREIFNDTLGDRSIAATW